MECLGNFKADWLANHGLTVVVERLELAYAEVGGTPWPLQKKAPRTHSSHGTLSNSPPPELLTDSLDARIESSKWHRCVNLRHKWAKRLPVGSLAQSQGRVVSFILHYDSRTIRRITKVIM